MPVNGGYPVGGKVPGKSAELLPGQGAVESLDVSFSGAGKGTATKTHGPSTGPGGTTSTGKASDSNP